MFICERAGSSTDEIFPWDLNRNSNVTRTVGHELGHASLDGCDDHSHMHVCVPKDMLYQLFLLTDLDISCYDAWMDMLDGDTLHGCQPINWEAGQTPLDNIMMFTGSGMMIHADQIPW